MRIALAAFVACLLTLATACSASPGTNDPEPSAAVSSSTVASSTAQAAPAPDLTSAPTTPPVGDELAFDRAAGFADGLTVQVDDVLATNATNAAPGVTGAEGTGGEVVLADVVVTNGTGMAYDATTIVVQGYYRGNVGAVMLADPSGTLGVGFAEEVPAGEQHKVRVGFAIPAAEAGDVTIVVDPRDWTNGPVRFRGTAIGD